MTIMSASRRRRGALTAAAAFLVGSPLAAFLLAPAAGASAGAPGSQLAGINTSAIAAPIQMAPLTPGIVGAGDLTKGNLVEVSVPYARSNVSTGPATGGLASPAYPGDTAAGAGTAIQTFAPSFPAPLVNLLNDPVLARSAYPPQVHTGTSGSYAPTGAALLGVGAASTQSGPADTTSTASVNDASSIPLIGVASAKASSSATLGAASVTTQAHSVLNDITIGGAVKIATISSDATASSNGTAGHQSSSLHVGAVTVAGVAASIGPDGITLNKTGLLGQLGLVAVANQALTALQQAGLSVRTIAPIHQEGGQSASVTSGVLQISFIDPNIPNPQGRLPIGSSIGLNIDLGLTQASANATGLPPFIPVPNVTPPPAGSPGSPGAPAVPGQPATVIPGGALPSGTSAPGPSFGSVPNTGASTSVPQASPQSGPVASLAGLLGVPVRMAWVILAVVLSIVAAGPLLAYANWQLLRGRTP